MKHSSLHARAASAALLALAACGLAHAEAEVASAPHALTTTKTLKQATPATVKHSTKLNVNATSQGNVVKRGENEYPSGQGIIPPKPKKDGLELNAATDLKQAPAARN